jgi:hypothetical protein
LVHEVLLFFLLLFNERVDQGVKETVEGWQNCRTPLLNASVVYFHVGSRLQGHLLLVPRSPRKVLRKTNALICWDVEGLGELLDPVVGFGLGLGVVPIEDDDHSLGFFHYSWPNSIIFDVACLVRRVPPTSQNSMEMSRLSTSVSCSTILTELVGR